MRAARGRDQRGRGRSHPRSAGWRSASARRAASTAQAVQSGACTCERQIDLQSARLGFEPCAAYLGARAKWRALERRRHHLEGAATLLVGAPPPLAQPRGRPRAQAKGRRRGRRPHGGGGKQRKLRLEVCTQARLLRHRCERLLGTWSGENSGLASFWSWQPRSWLRAEAGAARVRVRVRLRVRGRVGVRVRGRVKLRIRARVRARVRGTV